MWMRANPRDPGSNSSAPDRCDPCAPLTGAGEQLDRDGVAGRGRLREPRELGIERERRGQGPGLRDDHPAVQLGQRDALEVHRAARTRRHLPGALSEALESADPSLLGSGMQFDRVADRECTAQQSAGHDRTEASHLERPVDRESRRTPARGVGRGRLGELPERSAQLLDPRAFAGGDFVDGRACERSALEEVGGPPRRPAPARPSSATSHLVRAMAQRLMPSRSQMATCSRVCGITPSSAATTSSTRSIPVAPADHRPHERLVARHVDDAQQHVARKLERGEAELDRDAPSFLLREAVGVDAGERTDQRRLAVVDVSRSPEDESLSHTRARRTAAP